MNGVFRAVDRVLPVRLKPESGCIALEYVGHVDERQQDNVHMGHYRPEMPPPLLRRLC